MRKGAAGWTFHPGTRSILLTATMKGVLRAFKMSMHSKVCASRPLSMSTTRMAMSATLPPLRLRFVKASCPGVSTMSKPGISISPFRFEIKGPMSCLRVSSGK